MGLLLIAAILWALPEPVPQWKLDLCKQKIQPDRQMCLKRCELRGLRPGSDELLQCQSECQLELDQKFQACLKER